jgi:hypothetical protein
MGKLHPPRGAVKKLNLQMGFKLADGRRGARFRQTERLRRRRKTAQFGDTDKGRHGFEAIHCSYFPNSYVIFAMFIVFIENSKPWPSTKETSL